MAWWQLRKARPFPPGWEDGPPAPPPPAALRPTVDTRGEYEGGPCALSVVMDTGHVSYLDVYDGDHAGTRCVVDARLGPEHQVALSRVLGLWATDPGDVAARWQLERELGGAIKHLEVTGDREVIRLGLTPYTVRLTRLQAAALHEALEAGIHRP